MSDSNKKIVLVHDPKDELFLGVLHPDAALFADYMDVREANMEHRHFQRVLAVCGLDVRTVRDVLTEGTMDRRGKVIHGEALDELKSFAQQFLEYDEDANIDSGEQERYKQEVLRKAHPLDLVNIILNRPKIILHTTEDNTGFSADYVMRPMMNLLFTRDLMISTPKGVVIARLHSPQRKGERLVGEFCIKKLGITPIFKIPHGHYLEGGDYVLSGDTSFIGCGMRTTQGAIDLMLEADVFGTDRVIVVKDSLHNQAQMHLDTYFNMIAPDLGVLAYNRYDARPGDPEFLTVDIYERGKNGYKLAVGNEPFTGLMDKEGVKLIRVSEKDTAGFGPNFLPIGERNIVAVNKKTAAYRNAMIRNDVKIHWVDLTHCTKGYGAAHCLTQVFRTK